MTLEHRYLNVNHQAIGKVVELCMVLSELQAIGILLFMQSLKELARNKEYPERETCVMELMESKRNLNTRPIFCLFFQYRLGVSGRLQTTPKERQNQK